MPPTDNREPIEQLAEEFLDRRRRGERVTVEDYAAAHPDQADEIRDLFPTIVALEQVQSSEEAVEKPAFAAPERLGDLQILREIGRGGMGVVYEALQESLGRHVAVKVLPGRTLFDTRQLERFRREARTAAALQHPNIVPIYSVGEQDGLHYLVMQKIDGAGLDVLTRRVGERTKSAAGSGSSLSLSADDTVTLGLADGLADALVRGSFHEASLGGQLPLPSDSASEAQTVDFSSSSSLSDAVRARSLGMAIADQNRVDIDALDPEYYQSVAKIGAQAADALGYAHSRGVLHRDVKPANLLLDRTGRVWITDFGLAKAVDQADVSRTGELLGTLRYMAPEQLRGQATAQSDLYSLGLTLYELVTFRSPFDAPTPSEVLQKINEHCPDRPSKLNRKLPADLEKIILRAMAAGPTERYATGADMAADLRRYLDNEPIAARAPRGTSSISRWAKRNGVAVGLAAGVLLMGLATVVAAMLLPKPPLPPDGFPPGNPPLAEGDGSDGPAWQARGPQGRRFGPPEDGRVPRDMLPPRGGRRGEPFGPPPGGRRGPPPGQGFGGRPPENGDVRGPLPGGPLSDEGFRRRAARRQRLIQQHEELLDEQPEEPKEP